MLMRTGHRHNLLCVCVCASESAHLLRERVTHLRLSGALGDAIVDFSGAERRADGDTAAGYFDADTDVQPQSFALLLAYELRFDKAAPVLRWNLTLRAHKLRGRRRC